MSSEEEHGPFGTWGILGGIAITFLAWGLLIYFVIGEKGPPDWDFSVISDIPGESTYSTYNPARPHGLVPGIEPTPVEPQHVMKPVSKTQQMEAPK